MKNKQPIVFFSVSYKKSGSGKLYNIAVFNVPDSDEATKQANEYFNKTDLPRRKYNTYGTSKHIGNAGDKLKGFNVILHR